MVLSYINQDNGLLTELFFRLFLKVKFVTSMSYKKNYNYIIY